MTSVGRNIAKSGPTTALRRAIKKYGAYQFSIELLATTNTKEDLKELEKIFIMILRTHTTQRGYNMTWGGDGISGFLFTPELKRKVRDGIKKSFQNPEILRRHMVTFEANKATAEEVSVAMKSHWAKSSWKEKQRKAIQIGLNKPESRQRLSEARKKVWSNPKTRLQASETARRIKNTPEAKEANSKRAKIAWAKRKSLQVSKPLSATVCAVTTQTPKIKAL